MLQFRRIKTFIPKGETELVKFDEPLIPNIEFKSLADFVNNYAEEFSQVPETERVNVYCTVNHVIEGVEKRVESWKEQDIIFFDIDDVSDLDKEQVTKYLEIMAPLCATTPENLVAITTGSGFHILLSLKKPITSKSYFEEHRIHFQVLCSRINEKFQAAGLTGSLDAQVFAPNRMCRAPLSIWEKRGEQKPVTLSFKPPKIKPVDFDLKKLSGLPDVEQKDQMSEQELTYIRVDNKTVETGCEFLKWTKKYQAKVSEPQWYAMLSVIGRLDQGKSKVHDYSKKHPSYNDVATDRKLDQALNLSGPRTCSNIQSLWKGCDKCPYYKKVRSPIAIKGKDFIATAHAGFHMMNAKGGLTPQYDDLKKFYAKETPYINANSEHYRFEQNHWEFEPDVFIDNFAEEHFSPPARNTMANEFRGKIKRTELRKPTWFSESTERRINLSNGVLNIDTGVLEPHSPKYGFKYILDYPFDEAADCPKFRQLISNVTKGDVALQTVLMEYMGYALSGDAPLAQKALVMTGSGANGKSTFLNVFKAIMGQSVTYLGVSDLQNHFHLQMLDGSLLNIMEEMPKFSDAKFWELFKNLVVGGSVTVSAKGKTPYSIHPKSKILMTCNELPKGANANHGFFRRLIIVPFDAVFSKDTKGFNRKLDQEIIEEELPGVLNICLKAYQSLKDQNYEFTSAERIDGALDDYKLEVDTVLRWVSENVELRESGGVQTEQRADGWLTNQKGKVYAVVSRMYADYKKDCDENGEKAWSRNAFTKKLRVAIDAVSKKSPGTLLPEFSKQRVDGKPEPVILNISYKSGGEY